MTPDETARLATAVHGLRPEWETASLRTLLGKHAHKPLNVVAAAAIWIASDPTTETPGRLNEAGPWWPEQQPAPMPRYGTQPASGKRAPCGLKFCVCTHTAPCDMGWITVAPKTPTAFETVRRCPNCTPAGKAA